MSGTRWVGELSDIAGFKVGIAANLDALEAGARRAGVEAFWTQGLDTFYRVRSEEVEELVRGILVHLGDPDAGDRRLVALALREDLANLPDLDSAVESVTKHMSLITSKPGPSGFDPAPFLDAVEADCGPAGTVAGLHMLKLLNARATASPWSKIRRREWSDLVELRDLYESEDVSATYGTFFAQRFIDFLAENFAEVDHMNWRKFEGLAGEWFKRLGYDVEFGPGRNDDGVDIRAWPIDAGRGQPPVLIAQCKRQTTKISKVVLKALYADVLHDKAGRGVIVTTSRFAPGTDRINSERGYGIEEANRDVVEQWIRELRTPGTGIFLAE